LTGFTRTTCQRRQLCSQWNSECHHFLWRRCKSHYCRCWWYKKYDLFHTYYTIPL